MKRRSNVAPQPYQRRGILAVQPQAFLELFASPESRENDERDGVAIVDICGPLTQYDEWFFDSYESIKARVQIACESSATAIVLRIDSPGGDVAGCFDAARAIREMCAAAGKPLWAYADKAHSAGYALAAAASRICVGDTSLVGSVGVIAAREDFSAMNAARGLRVALITSGARKADGNPDAPITDSELKATQQIVDSLAGVFFEHVASLRGISTEQVQGWQAGVFHGAAAIRAGLADEVCSFDAMLAAIASGGKPMSAYEKARAALEEAAAGDDANAEAAKRALAAMEPETESDEPDGDEPADKPADKPAGKPDDKPDAASDEEAPADDDDKPKPAAAAASSDIAIEALAEVHRLRAARAVEGVKAERRTLLASRPDFSPDLRAVLQKAPIEKVRNLVKTLPKAPTPRPAATAAVAGTRGMSSTGMPQGGYDTPLASAPASAPVAAINELDRAMGLTTTELGCRREGSAMVFGIIERPAAQKAGAK